MDDKSSSKKSTSSIPGHGPEAKPTKVEGLTEVDNAKYTLSNGQSSLPPAGGEDASKQIVSLNGTISKSIITVEVDGASDANKQTISLNSTISEAIPINEADICRAPAGALQISSIIGISEAIPINEDDNSDTLSDAWLRLNGITLYKTDKYCLLEEDSWINGSHMTAVQLLLKLQFPHLKSLQDTLKQDIGKMQPAPAGSLQILLVNRNHWVVASTCGTNNDTDITLYDSMARYSQSFIHDHTKLLLSHLVHTKQKFFTVSVANVNKQAGGNDCGLFAAAYCTSIAYGQNPSSFVYNQALMREHLLKCLEAKHMTPFPTMRQRRIPQSKIVRIEVFCYCRSPNDKKEMVQCDKKGYLQSSGRSSADISCHTRTKMVL